MKKLSKTFLLLFVLVLGGLVLPTEVKAGLITDYVELKVTPNVAPSTPNIDNFNTGAWTTDNTLTLQFDLSDPDSGDIINYQIQIDDTDDFSSPVVNYTELSGSASPRDNVQYTPSALNNGSYYWRIKAIDDDLTESSWATANSGAIAFKVDATAPTISSPTSSDSSDYIHTNGITIYYGDDMSSAQSFILSGSALDEESGLNQATFTSTCLGSPEADVTPASWTATYSDVGNDDTCSGASLITVTVSDVAGNTASQDYVIIHDATVPSSFDLDSPEDNSYTNSEQPTFKWKVASTPDATSGLLKYRVEVDNGDSGDFSIDNIPTSRTTDYETNKYVAHYHGFSDSDSANNYIFVHTKSSSNWGSEQNDGKLKKGKRSWKVKAVDNVGNEREESRTLFVDKNGPELEVTQINNTSFADSLATTDKTPTIYGKTTDSLNGDKTDNKVVSGPKEVEIKFEKRSYLGVYSLYALATVNIDELYWTADDSEIIDNSKNTSDKYSSFSYTPTTNLPLGIYRVTLTGKDEVDNSGEAFSFTLTIKTFEEITKIPEVKKTIEKIKKEEKVPTEKIKEMINKQNIVVPEELKGPSKITETVGKLFAGVTTLWWKTVEAWRTSRKSTIKPASGEVQNLATKLKIATNTFMAIVFDKEPTRIADIQVEKITSTTAVVYWATNHHATSKVNYGFSTSYGQEVFSNQRVKEHRMVLKNLEPEKLYYFEVMSQGKNYVYDAYYTFTTPTQENEEKE